jgi:GNAT superfamily N-acetyltransferase
MDGVMLGDVKMGPASASLSILGVVLPDLRDNIREISSFYVKEDERGKGAGTALLKAICEQADEYCLALLVLVERSSLVAWYSRHGFDVLQDNPIVMVRPCRVIIH